MLVNLRANHNNTVVNSCVDAPGVGADIKVIEARFYMMTELCNSRSHWNSVAALLTSVLHQLNVLSLYRKVDHSTTLSGAVVLANNSTIKVVQPFAYHCQKHSST